MARTDFNVTIAETSMTELSAKDKIMLKDTSDAIALDKALADDDSSLMITPIEYAILNVHNEKAKGDKDYTQLLILDANGEKYTTGSNSFMNSFMDIYNEMADSDEEYSIKVYRRASKNYAGKSFITCSIC